MFSMLSLSVRLSLRDRTRPDCDLINDDHIHHVIISFKFFCCLLNSIFARMAPWWCFSCKRQADVQLQCGSLRKHDREQQKMTYYCDAASVPYAASLNSQTCSLRGFRQSLTGKPRQKKPSGKPRRKKPSGSHKKPSKPEFVLGSECDLCDYPSAHFFSNRCDWCDYPSAHMFFWAGHIFQI